jgi:hypothetical protein
MYKIITIILSSQNIAQILPKLLQVKIKIQHRKKWLATGLLNLVVIILRETETLLFESAPVSIV